MVDYDVLRRRIINTVKENGKGEIMGKDTQDVLLQMLGASEENKKELGDKANIADAVGKKTLEGGEIFNVTDNNENVAKGLHSHAEGGSTRAVRETSHAEGHGGNALGAYAHVEGYSDVLHQELDNVTDPAEIRRVWDDVGGQIAFGSCSHAEGTDCLAIGDSAHTEGDNSVAEGEASHAEGRFTEAIGRGTHTEGVKTEARGDFGAHAEGYETKATGTTSHAEGSLCESNGIYSHAEGYDCKTTGIGSHAEGGHTNADGNGSHAEGLSTSATGENAHAEGGRTKAEGLCSHAEGEGSQAIHLAGAGNATSYDIVRGMFSADPNPYLLKFHLKGAVVVYVTGTPQKPITTTATIVSVGQHPEGGCFITLDKTLSETPIDSRTQELNISVRVASSGDYSHVEGAGCTAQNITAHAEGDNNTALGEGSHSEGGHNVAEGMYSHSEGFRTEAVGVCSHVEGGYYDPTQQAHVGGGVAGGKGAHAEGALTSADGDFSHAEGVGCITTNKGEHACGRYNWSDESDGTTLFSIGIGTSYEDRKNAVQVNTDGSVFIVGVGGFNGTNSVNAKSLQQILHELGVS